MKATVPREEEELGAPDPHIYSVGALAYKQLRETGRNQSIVVTGISGAGKTEANKYLLKYLCWRANETNGEEPEMAKVVLSSTPVFEAFGNATTVMNPNSSRFGKFMRVLFDSTGAVAGASISTYLLEKSRLAVQQPGEANFHIFYQILKGLDQGSIDTLRLQREPSSYHYLSRATGSAAGNRDGLDDVADFEATVSAMKLLELQPEAVFRIIAGILHLGNVSFTLIDPEDAEGGTVATDPAQVAIAEELLGMTRLSDALTIRRVQAGGGRTSMYDVPQTREGAGRARDALTKKLYDRLFTWLVATINERVAKRGTPRGTAEGTMVSGKWIGLLDIFGFEIFASNSLEQLLINLANEKLQRFFLDSVFRYEQAHYEAEQIEWVPVEVPDNGPIVAAIEDSPNGVLALLDEQCWLGERGSDITLCNLINQRNTICAATVAAMDQKARARFDPHVNFTLTHFVAPVTYTTTEFIEKNRDSVFEELSKALAGSTSPLVKVLFPSEELADEETRARTGSGKSYGSVASKFGVSLTELLKELASTDPGFIRTIKPNASLSPGAPDERLILEQLRTCGMLQAVKMIRSMYPTRIPYADIMSRYGKCLFSYSFMAAKSPKAFTAAVCEAFDVDPNEYRLGNTKLFIKGGCAVALNKLLRGASSHAEQLLDEALLRLKVLLWRKERKIVEGLMRWASRARARLGKPPIDPTTTHVHAYRVLRREYVDRLWKNRAAARLQAKLKARRQRERYELERHTTRTLQRAARGLNARNELSRLRAEAAERERIRLEEEAERERIWLEEEAARERRRQEMEELMAKEAAEADRLWEEEKRRNAAAIKLQTAMRRTMAQLYLKLALAAVRVCQSTWRMLHIQIIRRRLVNAALVLQKGAVMLKYKQKGVVLGLNHEPHRRFVWLSKDMRNLCWSKPEEQEFRENARAMGHDMMSDGNRVIPNKTLGLSTVSAISTGAKTEVLIKMDKDSFTRSLFAQKKPGCIDDNAFSIISPQRRLDLYAESRKERDSWSNALRVILMHGHTVDTAYLIAYSRKQKHEREMLAGLKIPSEAGNSELESTIHNLKIAESELASDRSPAVDEFRKLSARGMDSPHPTENLAARFAMPDSARESSAFVRFPSFFGKKKVPDGKPLDRIAQAA